jgi:hypothetical protein
VCCSVSTTQPPGSPLPPRTGRNLRQTGCLLLVASYDMQEDTAVQFYPGPAGGEEAGEDPTITQGLYRLHG